MLTVRRLTAGDLAAVTAIIAGLPDYFTDDVPDQAGRDLAEHGGWAAVDRPVDATPGGVLVAFAIVARKSPEAAEILWMAVSPERRGQGAGTLLADRVLADLAADGIRVVEVKTLDQSAGYPPYEATRGFWLGRGFVQIDTVDPLPGWDAGSPAAICVAALRPTR